MVAVTALVGAAALGLWLFSIHDRAADVDPSPILADASGSDAASDGAPTVDWEFWLSVNPDIGFWLERLLAEADVVLDVDVEADSVKAFCTCSYGRWNGHERTIVYAREEVV